MYDEDEPERWAAGSDRYDIKAIVGTGLAIILTCFFVNIDCEVF